MSVGKIKLSDVFDEAVKHTEECLIDADIYPNPTVTILTDNWNPKTFAKYETKFIDYIINHGVYVYFFLVTGYGITRIPFLCGKNIKQFGDKYKGETIQKSSKRDRMTLKEVVDTIGHHVIINTYNYPNIFEWKKLELYLGSLEWYFYDYKKEEKEGDLSKSGVIQFVNSVAPLIEKQREIQHIYNTCCVFQDILKNAEGNISVEIPQQGVKFEIDIQKARADHYSIDGVMYDAVNRLLDKSGIDFFGIA